MSRGLLLTAVRPPEEIAWSRLKCCICVIACTSNGRFVALHRRDNFLENVTWKWKICGQLRPETLLGIEDPEPWTPEGVVTEIIGRTKNKNILYKAKIVSQIKRNQKSELSWFCIRSISIDDSVCLPRMKRRRRMGKRSIWNYHSILVEAKQTQTNRVSTMQHMCMTLTLMAKKAKLYQLRDYSSRMEHIRNNMGV